MQSDPPKFHALPCEPSATPRPAPQGAHAGFPAPYTPRTVWQTPHGLAPNFTARRSARNGRTDPLTVLVRRGLRLTYRLRRLLAARPGTPRAGWGRQRLAIPS